MEYNRDNSGGNDPQSPKTQGVQQNGLHMVNPTPETAQGQLPSLLSLRLHQSPTYPFSMPSPDVDTMKYTAKPLTPPKPSPKSGVVGGVDITRWATDPTHEQKITTIFNGIKASSTPQDIHNYIVSRASKAVMTGRDVWDAAQQYGIDPKLILAITQQDSSFGTAGKGARTNNPGNVGNDDAGNTQRYKTMRDGVFAVAKLLAKWKVKGESQMAGAAGMLGVPQAAGETIAPVAPSTPMPSLLSLRMQKPFSVNPILDDQEQSKAFLKGTRDLVAGPRPKTYGEAKQRGLIPFNMEAFNFPPETPVPENERFIDGMGFMGSMKNVEQGVFKGAKNLTTKILEDLKGRTTVSKQYILDATNRPDLKQPERDLIRKVLDDMSAQKADTSGPFEGGMTVYRGGIPYDRSLFNSGELRGLSVSKDMETAQGFAGDLHPADKYQGGVLSQGKKGVVEQLSIDKNAKILDVNKAPKELLDIMRKENRHKGVEEISLWAEKNGYDAVDFHDFEIRVLNPDVLKSSPSIPKEKIFNKDTIDVNSFAEKVQSELLPLKRNVGGNMYEGVTLPSELRGPVADYSDHIYSSPIKTSAGDVHFSRGFDQETGSAGAPNYFAHTRIEDLPDNSTRRVIEAQSDLFQKGRLEGEKIAPSEELMQMELEHAAGKVSTKDFRAAEDKFYGDRNQEISKLEPYRNTWHERVIREEIKQAAKDGKTKLQFPTGETAMKIEGLGETQTFDLLKDASGARIGRLTPENAKVGGLVADRGGSYWIITDVLGDGKFKAVPKSSFDRLKATEDGILGKLTMDEFKNSATYRNFAESFDISGKVDTNNPIYKFYEKEVGKYLQKKYGAQLITDAQGVRWWQLDVPKEAGKMPVEAFGVGALPFLTQDEENSDKIK